MKENKPALLETGVWYVLVDADGKTINIKTEEGVEAFTRFSQGKDEGMQLRKAQDGEINQFRVCVQPNSIEEERGKTIIIPGSLDAEEVDYYELTLDYFHSGYKGLGKDVDVVLLGQ